MAETLENLIIRTCTLEEEPIIGEMHHTAFTSSHGKKRAKENYNQLKEQLARGHILVAVLDREIAGFAGYDFAEDNPEHKEMYLEIMLYHARNPEQKETLLEHFRERQKEYGGEVVLEYFSNFFTQPDLKIRDADMNLTHLSISPKWRRKGIGEALTKKRIEIAQKKCSSAIYVHCWEKNGIVQLYKKLGFLPIIRGGPTYADGSPMTFMGLLLQ